MDFKGSNPADGSKWAWTRTGALILFLVTGVLLLASLGSVRDQQAQSGAADPGITSSTQ